MKPHRKQRIGVYLLPSALTIGNMLLGFYAIISGLRGAFGDDPGEFQKAALLLFAAGIVDTLDGRIARLTGTDSEFGKEYDSLADLLTFGVAPALLVYLWGLADLGRIGWLVPLFFVVCTATRLARFNVQTKSLDSRYFVGLPAPAAAGTVCSILFLAPDSEWRQILVPIFTVTLVVVASLMVSTFRYPSFKQVELRRRRSYRTILPIAAVILVAAVRPSAFFLAAAISYTLSGPITSLRGRLNARRPEHQQTEDTPESTP
ncbi:MAG: CDP-diacylglycerol--serine O-phosphatidyltransferase [Acidobacteriota bacterium]